MSRHCTLVLATTLLGSAATAWSQPAPAATGTPAPTPGASTTATNAMPGASTTATNAMPGASTTATTGPPAPVPASAVAPPSSPIIVAPPPEAGQARRWHEHFAVGLGVHLAGSESAWTHVALVGEASGRVPGVPAPFMIRGRGFVAIAGSTEQSDWSGEYSLAGGGIEALACTGGQGFCGVVGADLGWEHATLVDDNSGTPEGSRSGPVFGPRFGIEAGGERARFRFLIERYRWRIRHDPSDWISNGGVTFGGAYRF